MLSKLLREREPDLRRRRAGTSPAARRFRKESFADYKATRAPMPEELSAADPADPRALEAHRIPILELAGFRGRRRDRHARARPRAARAQVAIVIADKDLMQLVGDRACCSTPACERTLYDAKAVEEDFGVPPVAGARRARADGRPVGQRARRDGHRREGRAELIQRVRLARGLLAHAAEVTRSATREGLLEQTSAGAALEGARDASTTATCRSSSTRAARARGAGPRRAAASCTASIGVLAPAQGARRARSRPRRARGRELRRVETRPRRRAGAERARARSRSRGIADVARDRRRRALAVGASSARRRAGEGRARRPAPGRRGEACVEATGRAARRPRRAADRPRPEAHPGAALAGDVARARRAPRFDTMLARYLLDPAARDRPNPRSGAALEHSPLSR